MAANNKGRITAELISQFGLDGTVGIEAFANQVWAKAFALGYERGKADERDAFDIDKALENDKLQ